MASLPTITASFGASLETKAEFGSELSGVSEPALWMLGDLPTVAGPAVTPSSALQVPAVAACVTLISGAIAALPVKVYTDAKDGGRQEAHDHPAYALVHDEANDWTAAGQLRGQLVADAMLYGAGYGLVRRDPNGTPYEILRLDPRAVSVMLHPVTGEPVFRLTVAGGQTAFTAADMIFVPAPVSLDGITGTATIQRARDTIALALALERHASRIFRKGARPSGIITAPNTKMAEAAENLRRSFTRQNADENSGGVAVAYGGLTFTATEFKSVDAQFMEQRQFQIHEIAKAFNVPPTMIGELAKATLSNSEQMGRQFLQTTLLPWINTLRAAYRRTLIPREDRKIYSIDFVTDGLLQADSAQRASFYASMRASGSMTANEVRRLENLPDHPEGNTLTSPHIAAPTASALEPSHV